MSDFVSRDMLPDLWEEILRRHWTFLETEESMQKLEERKKLESCLKEFLCVVPHDRKFFLPETAHVLKKSIREMSDFTAYKAMIGFESISQYANNLFTKPWRKEYRVIKMYSGFYHHEIKSNLIDAEKLFEAMGYRQLPNQILVLDGPICPDQVTNVSRDAMAAYVECQIMNQIYAGLAALSLSCPWLNVFNYRETHYGGASHAIKGIAYAIQERRFRKDQLINSENCYATIQHAANSPQGAAPPAPQGSGFSTGQMVSSCSNCAHTSSHHHRTLAQHLANGCSVHSTNNMTGTSNQHHPPPASSCGIHHHQSAIYGTVPSTNVVHLAYNGNKMSHPSHPHGAIYSHMSHSRSLEHYNDQQSTGIGGSAGGAPPLPHRHSFDQQQGCGAGHNIYDIPYDCVDDGVAGVGNGLTFVGSAAACNFNAYTHPYNVSGNRYPLPYNISNQLNTQYSCNGSGSPAVVAASNIPTYPYADCNGFTTAKQKQSFDAAAGAQPSSYSNHHHPRGIKDFQAYRQRSFPPDHQLIDFEERAMDGPPVGANDLHSRSQNNSFDYSDRSSSIYDNKRRILSSTSNRLNSLLPQTSSSLSGLPQAKDLPCNRIIHHHHPNNIEHSSIDLDENYGYSTPMTTASALEAKTRAAITRPRTNDQNNMTEKYLKNAEFLPDYEKALAMDKKKRLPQPATLELQQSNHHQQTQTHINRGGTTGMNGDSVGGLNNYNHHDNHHNHQLVLAPHLADSYDSLDDFVNIESIPAVTSFAVAAKSPSQANKNQDGVGSFESWDYVFQNLEKHGYSKDLGERGDLFVQSLDLDSMNVSAVSAADKRRISRISEGKSRQLNGEKSKTLEKTPTVTAGSTTTTTTTNSSINRMRGGEKSILKPQQQGVMENGTTSSITTTTKVIKSALKPAITTAITDNNITNNNGDERNSAERRPKITTNPATVSKSNRLNSSSSSTATRNGTTTTAGTTTRATSKSTRLALPAGASTQVIVSSPNEWSCRFCTFLNPDTKRICEMCCRSKDFNLESNNTPTCV